MAYYNKIGLLVLNADATAFLVCQPRPDDEDRTTMFLLPGGKIEPGETDVACLVREIREELSCGLAEESLQLVGEYTDVAASHPDRDVMIRLYRGTLVGEPRPASEIAKLHWVGKASLNHPDLSPLLKRKVIPDLLRRGIMR